MIKKEKKLSTTATIGLLIFGGLIAAGCPSFTIDRISLVEESATTEGFTIEAAVSVLEEDPAVDDDGNLSGGRGILGIWLPPGWSADQARATGPSNSEFVALQPINDAYGHFPPTFPHADGQWFAFVSGCDNIARGEFSYTVQVDISGDVSSDAVTMGISTALFDDSGSKGPAPTEISVDLNNKIATVAEAPAAPASSNLEQCESIPYEEAPGEDEGCSCGAIGSPNPKMELLESILKLF